MISVANIIAGQGYYTVWRCAKLAETLSHDATPLAQKYPSCAPYVDGSNLAAVSAISADFNGESSENVGAALNISFGTAVWLGFVIHALGVEIYVSLGSPATQDILFFNNYAVASHSQGGRAP